MHYSQVNLSTKYYSLLQGHWSAFDVLFRPWQYKDIKLKFFDFSLVESQGNETFSIEESQGNKSCIFPFIYDGNTYYGCWVYGYGGLPWCSTEVDENGVHVDTKEQENLNACDPDCMTQEEAMKSQVKWKKEKTFKMTLQYNNSALWTGLELYGILLTYSLILTVLVTAIGKMIVTIYQA